MIYCGPIKNITTMGLVISCKVIQIMQLVSLCQLIALLFISTCITNFEKRKTSSKDRQVLNIFTLYILILHLYIFLCFISVA